MPNLKANNKTVELFFNLSVNLIWKGEGKKRNGEVGDKRWREEFGPPKNLGVAPL